MKLKKYISVFCSIALLLTACAKKEVIKSSSSTVGISKITFFPTIETLGERLIILQEGDAYTDAGASAIVNGEEQEYSTNLTVDVNTPGIYDIVYSIENEDGFSVSDWRTVVVIGTDVSGNDFSGTYARYVAGVPNGQTSSWTKIGNGIYTVVNPGGATGVTATVVNYEDDLVEVPKQITEAGEFYSVGGEYFPSLTPPEYHWAIVNASYGTAVRTFKKLP